MLWLTEAPPLTRCSDIVETLHGVSIRDPYRWIEDQSSQETRDWLAAQENFKNSYLDSLPGRAKIRDRVEELLDVETIDSVLISRKGYIFRKRLPNQQQASIWLREGLSQEDQLLVDPAELFGNAYTAIRPLRVSRDGKLLLYGIKEGGERTSRFAIFDVSSRQTLQDLLPRGYLRGFAFSDDCRGFYYVHHHSDDAQPSSSSVYHHLIGKSFADDRRVFFVSQGPVRLQLLEGRNHLGILVYRFLDNKRTDFYLSRLGTNLSFQQILKDADFKFVPILLDDGTLVALTDHRAPNSRIVRVAPDAAAFAFSELIPNADARIQSWAVTRNRIFVSYIRGTCAQIKIFNLQGQPVGELPVAADESLQLTCASPTCDALLFETQSFTQRPQKFQYSSETGIQPWDCRPSSVNVAETACAQTSFIAKDGVSIPMFLVAKSDALRRCGRPVIMTAYGGHGLSATPQFSALVTLLIEYGGVFALPAIRGGSEFGAAWHQAARRKNRQVAFDDFLCAAQWLIDTEKAQRDRLGIFGCSNAGLLVAAAVTQRPDLFRVVLCLAPILDMLRYHLFDGAGQWKQEFGTADNRDDLEVLRSYSPYHNVHDGIAYPAIMIVSGDADQNSNPLHARKMIARLQAASSSGEPTLLDYNPHRGHSPVLPLKDRVESLTDRLLFLCAHLGLPQ